MAKAEFKSKMSLEINFTLKVSLQEARALKAIVGCDVESFIKIYYEKLGKSYLQPHEDGVRSLFETLKDHLGSEIYDAEKIIDAINAVEGLNSQFRAEQAKTNP